MHVTDVWGLKNVCLKRFSACSVALLVIAALSGCSAVLEFLHPKNQEPNQYPAAYRTELLNYLKNNPTEITAVREAYISAPSMKPFGSESRYFVCVKVSDGEQVEKIAFLSAEKIIQFVDAGDQCASAFYQLFPELTAMFAQATRKK
jgi:hypothetical protein